MHIALLYVNNSGSKIDCHYWKSIMHVT